MTKLWRSLCAVCASILCRGSRCYLVLDSFHYFQRKAGKFVFMVAWISYASQSHAVLDFFTFRTMALGFHILIVWNLTKALAYDSSTPSPWRLTLRGVELELVGCRYVFLTSMVIIRQAHGKQSDRKREFKDPTEVVAIIKACNILYDRHLPDHYCKITIGKGLGITHRTAPIFKKVTESLWQGCSMKEDANN